MGSILSWEDAQDYPSSDRLSTSSNLAPNENSGNSLNFYNNMFMNNNLNSFNHNTNSNGTVNTGVSSGVQVSTNSNGNNNANNDTNNDSNSNNNNTGITPFGLPTHLLANFLG